MAGKGSRQRPAQIPEAELDRRWAEIFPVAPTTATK